MIIYLEGNIGSGKSTFINFLKEKIVKDNWNADVLLEPVEEWEATQDSNGTNILQHYYQDQVKFGFAFQINALISRVKKIDDMIKQSKKKIHFIERSIFTDKNVFLESNYHNGNITEIEYVIYQQWFNWILQKFKMTPDGFILLNTTYQQCAERIRSRNRTGEETIPLEYLKMIEDYHTKWLSKEEQVNKIPILYINSSVNFYENNTVLETELQRISQFMDFLKKEKINMV
jgi:deoxyadenosine/deoxycytidine kinase